MADLVIRNAQVVTPWGMVNGGVAIEGETIVAVGPELPQARQEVDAQGLVVLPGLIDPHTHMGAGPARGQAREKFESDFRDVSVEAAVGGITTVITTALFGSVRESLLPCLREARERGQRSSLVDFRLTAIMLYPPHIRELLQMLEAGVTSYKFLLGYRGEEGAQIGVHGITWGFVYEAFEAIARYLPALAMIHAEEPEIIEPLRERLKGGGRADLGAWSDSRPGVCETMHVLSAGVIAQKLGTPLYVVHTSARESLEAARFLRQQGTQLYLETCPHYLHFTRDKAPEGPWAKVNPPLRDEADQEALWQGLSDGTIDTIGSDHCCYQRAHKQGGIWEAMPGFPGLGATLALLVSEGVNQGRLSWERLAQITAENTARLFRLYPKKGALIPGADADLVVVDPEKEWELNARTIHSASDFSPYDGVKVKGKAVKVFLRGRLIVDEGEPVARGPLGQFVPPQ